MKQRLISLCLLLCLALGLLHFVPVASAVTYLDSGITGVEKLTKGEIKKLLAQHAPEANFWEVDPNSYFKTKPSLSNPHTPGSMNATALQNILGRLNDLRLLGGLNPAQLDTTLCESAQYGAVLLTETEFSHTPAKPAGMSQSFYEKGYAATSSSNLAGGTSPLQAIDSFMEDFGASNATTVGHRRWQLNPHMGKVGFGYAYDENTDYRHYVAEKVFDQSVQNVNYKFISWPASGNFPREQFNAGTVWNITLNPQQYTIPTRESITLTVVRESDGKTWKFDKNTSTDPSAGRFFLVNRGGYGVANSILFRIPSTEVDLFDGVYTVTINGLKTASGAATSFAYQVDFFSVKEPQKVLGYWDIAETDWYYKNGAIKFVKDNEYFYGIEEDLFGPNVPMTRAMFVTVLGRVHGVSANKANTVFSDVKKNSYYSGYVQWANKNGIVAGMTATTFAPDNNITREQICAMMARYCNFANVSLENADTVTFKDAGQISAYARKAVTACQKGGIISGEKHESDYYFYPGRSATRAEVATILMSFCQKYK